MFEYFSNDEKINPEVPTPPPGRTIIESEE